MDEKKLKNRITPHDLLKRFFVEYFDGVLLIDVDTQRLLNMGEEAKGRYFSGAKYDGTPYDEQVVALADKRIAPSEVDRIKNALSIATIKEKLLSQKTYTVEFNTVTKDNAIVFLQILYEYLDEQKDVILMLCKDVTKIVAGEIDPLTGCYNLTGFHRRVDEWIAANPDRKYRMQRYNIDRFRDINGVYGYKTGDKLLRDVGLYMRKKDSADSFSAHIGADHFVRFCAADIMTVLECCDNFLDGFADYDLNIPITPHIGVYDLCEKGVDSFGMSYRALLALQTIKGDMNKKIAYYKSEMLKKEQEHLQLLKGVESAIKNEQFEVWFQPQVDYYTKRIIGAEALLRWRHPTKGLLTPASFVPLLEKSNYVSKTDNYVIQKTCRYLRKWMDALPQEDIKVSVNLSRHDFYDRAFFAKTERILQSCGIPYSALHLEITESAYMTNPDQLIKEIDKLRQKGFCVEIDDFGTGYSSLNLLKSVSVDKIKLDMKFLSVGGDRKKSEVIIAAVIKAAQTLGLQVIAEGVETKQQADMLLGFGCNQMQGYFFSKPVTAEQYEDLLFKKTTLPNLV